MPGLGARTFILLYSGERRPDGRLDADAELLQRPTTDNSPILFGQHPLAVVDSDHHPCTVVEAVVLLRSHHEHAVRPDDVARLERIAQREAEFLRPRLGLLERLRHRLGEEQVAVVGWPPNVVRESLPYLASYGTM